LCNKASGQRTSIIYSFGNGNNPITATLQCFGNVYEKQFRIAWVINA